jgi:hypothetical protein
MKATMEQRIFIKIAFRDSLNAVEIFQKLAERSGKDALGHPSVMYSQREFCKAREDVEDIPRTGRPPDF